MMAIVTVSAGAYINSMLPYLLTNPDYFDIPFANVGTKSGEALFWAFLTSTLLTPAIGYAYDVIGRFWVIVPSLFTISMLVGIMHLSAPNFWLLICMRSLISCLINVVNVNPLLIDYIKPTSRGQVMGLSVIGLVFGELIMVVLFGMTRNLTLPQQFWVPAIFFTALCCTIIFLVREPKIKSKAK